MKTKVNFNHRLLMGLLVLGSVFSMIVSSAFTTSPAWAATLAQSGSNAVTSLSSISPASLGTENSVIQTVGTIQSSEKSTEKQRHQATKSENNEDTNSTNSVTELSGVISNLFVTPTRASFEVGGQGARMDANLINGFSFSDGDQVTVEGYYLGPNNNGTFLVTEVDKVP
jgi:predicted PurR-regulated permease PerM